MFRMLQAHGLDAGPTQRPLLAGGIASMAADVPLAMMLATFGTLDALALAIGASLTAASLAYFGMMLLSGMLYGGFFRRAANDPRGGWLYGLAFGFVLWMLGPVPLAQWIPVEPILAGRPALDCSWVSCSGACAWV
ncbi:MAG TPA: hypothetical protein VIL69_12015 [Roseomonas sp.]|jgi:hypothetical protein